MVINARIVDADRCIMQMYCSTKNHSQQFEGMNYISGHRNINFSLTNISIIYL